MMRAFFVITHQIPPLIQFRSLRSSSVACNNAFALQDIRILDLTRIIAGPTCTLTLADYGAEVIKIEHPERGDDTRRWPPLISEEISCTFASVNRNKKSVCLNFQYFEGQELLKSLAQECDVLVENYIPGVLSKYKLDYDSMKSCCPKLIYCSLNGFGSKGPYSRKAGVDLIAASMGGLLHLTGPEDGEPCRTGPSLVDLMSGLRAHGAIIAALYQRQKTKRGCRIEIDLFSTAVTALQTFAAASLNLGIETNRKGTEHEFVVPYKSFKTKDGYITTGAINDQQFKIFCSVLGVPDFATDDRFHSNVKRAENRKELASILNKLFLKKTTKEWCELLGTTSLPHGPLYNIAQCKSPPTLRLRCKKPKSQKSVKWNEGTVDNEYMNKKKSKCCCIYKKPKQTFDESSESESDECENCFGHVDVKKQKQLTAACCNRESHAESSNEPQPISLSQ